MSDLANFAGWIPAIIFPVATAIQLASIFRKRSATGVSWLVWLLFGVANVCLYIYTEKYGDIQSILSLLGTASLDFLIAGMAAMKYGGSQPHDDSPA